MYRSPNVRVIKSRVLILTGKRPLGRHRRRWEDNIRKDLEEIGINAGNWFDRLRIALVNAVLNLRVP